MYQEYRKKQLDKESPEDQTARLEMMAKYRKAKLEMATEEEGKCFPKKTAMAGRGIRRSKKGKTSKGKIAKEASQGKAKMCSTSW